MDEKVVARFWAKVNKSGPVPKHCPDLGECWEWTACRQRHGYGKFGITPTNIQLAHRVAWFIAFGAMPAGSCCHRCDNPSCVRVDHLFEGTHLDNMRDMVAKGRGSSHRRPQGARHGMAKLTEDDVREIRRLHASGLGSRRISQRYPVARHTIERILRRQIWRHVA